MGAAAVWKTTMELAVPSGLGDSRHGTQGAHTEWAREEQRAGKSRAARRTGPSLLSLPLRPIVHSGAAAGLLAMPGCPGLCGSSRAV